MHSHRASVGTWLGRSATSSGPCSPSFGIASTPVANSQPKRHQEIDGQAEGSNRRIRSKGVASLANEVRRAMMCRSRDAQASSHNNDSLLVPQQLFRGADWRWHGSLPECAPAPNEHRTVTPYNISLSLLLLISVEMITACFNSLSLPAGCVSWSSVELPLRSFGRLLDYRRLTVL